MKGVGSKSESVLAQTAWDGSILPGTTAAATALAAPKGKNAQISNVGSQLLQPKSPIRIGSGKVKILAHAATQDGDGSPLLIAEGCACSRP